MRIHARVLNTRSLSILCGAISMHAATNLPSTSYVDGYLPAPAAISSSLIFAKTASDDDFHWDVNGAGRKVERKPELRPLSMRNTTVSDPSSIFLLSKRAEGSYSTGTGTIVKGDLDVHRVLTAGHVSEKDLVPHEQTLMFDGEGRYLGELTPVMIVNYHGDSRKEGATSVMNDIAVMSVRSFANDEIAEKWTDLAVHIAQDQPAHPLFVVNGVGDTTLNTGMSGASLRNQHNEVVGVLLGAVDMRGFTAPKTPDRLAYLDKLFAENKDADVDLPFDLLLSNKTMSEMPINMSGVAAPVLHPAVLGALGVHDVAANPKIPAFHAQVSGFPIQEAATSTMFVTPMTEYSAEAFIKHEEVRTYASPIRENTINLMQARRHAPE